MILDFSAKVQSYQNSEENTVCTSQSCGPNGEVIQHNLEDGTSTVIGQTEKDAEEAIETPIMQIIAPKINKQAVSRPALVDDKPDVVGYAIQEDGRLMSFDSETGESKTIQLPSFVSGQIRQSQFTPDGQYLMLPQEMLSGAEESKAGLDWFQFETLKDAGVLEQTEDGRWKIDIKKLVEQEDEHVDGSAGERRSGGSVSKNSKSSVSARDSAMDAAASYLNGQMPLCSELGVERFMPGHKPCIDDGKAVALFRNSSSSQKSGGHDEEEVGFSGYGALIDSLFGYPGSRYSLSSFSSSPTSFDRSSFEDLRASESAQEGLVAASPKANEGALGDEESFEEKSPSTASKNSGTSWSDKVKALANSLLKQFSPFAFSPAEQNEGAKNDLSKETTPVSVSRNKTDKAQGDATSSSMEDSQPNSALRGLSSDRLKASKSGAVPFDANSDESSEHKSSQEPSKQPVSTAFPDWVGVVCILPDRQRLRLIRREI